MNVERTFSLEDRTYEFARDCRFLINDLKKIISNIEDGKQLIRSSGSVGANYIEGNEKLGDKDLKLRLKYQERKPKKVNIG